MKLTIHIGLHKTGTTFLQRQFLGQPAQLAQQGWLFPRTGFTDHSGHAAKAEATPGHQGIVNAALSNNKGTYRRLFREIEGTGCKNVLVSCENLSFPFLSRDQRVERLEKVARFFSAFEEIEVVAVLRRPDTYLESLYRERVASLETRETRTAMRFAEAIGHRALNFREMLEPWQHLSDNNLKVFSYEALRDQPDYLGAFAAKLGLVMTTSQEGTRRIYSSPDRETIEVVRLANSLGDNDALHSATLAPFLRAASHYQRQAPSLLAMSPLFRENLLVQVESTSQEFLSRCGLAWDFAAMRAQIDAEKSTWVAMDTIDARLLESYASFARTARDLRNSKGLAQAVRRTILKPALRDPLLRLYGALPDPGKRLVRSLYSRWGR